MIVAPATFNTINKWAAGISDTLALGLLTEAIGKKIPVVALPFTNRDPPPPTPRLPAASTTCAPGASRCCSGTTCTNSTSLAPARSTWPSTPGISPSSTYRGPAAAEAGNPRVARLVSTGVHR